MARFTFRVAALAAVTVFLLQAACAIGFTSVAHPEVTPPTGSGCHETAPATPSAPDPGHVCCGGDHSPDALLRVANVAAVSMGSQMLRIPAFDLAAPGRLFTATVSPSSGPPVPLARRI